MLSPMHLNPKILIQPANQGQKWPWLRHPRLPWTLASVTTLLTLGLCLLAKVLLKTTWDKGMPCHFPLLVLLCLETKSKSLELISVTTLAPFSRFSLTPIISILSGTNPCQLTRHLGLQFCLWQSGFCIGSKRTLLGTAQCWHSGQEDLIVSSWGSMCFVHCSVWSLFDSVRNCSTLFAKFDTSLTTWFCLLPFFLLPSQLVVSVPCFWSSNQTPMCDYRCQTLHNILKQRSTRKLDDHDHIMYPIGLITDAMWGCWRNVETILSIDPACFIRIHPVSWLFSLMLQGHRRWNLREIRLSVSCPQFRVCLCRW